MHVHTTRLPSLRTLGLLILLLFTNTVAAAPSPDRRLVDAMAARDTALVRALMEDGVNVNTARADGVTALLWATHWDDGDRAELLLGAGANVNARDDHGVTPLARACENASTTMVTRLLDAGADPNTAQANGLTPLMTAARTGKIDVVRTLLLRGASINAATPSTDETAPMRAVAGGRPHIVRALVEQGADVHPRPRQAFSPLIAAARNDDIKTATILVAAGARVDDTGSDGSHPLTYAIVAGQSAFALFLLELGADPNGTIDGVTALHAAAGPVDAWLKAWQRELGGTHRGRLTLEERLTLVNALLARDADQNARMTASDMAGLGFLRNGAYDTFTTGTGDVGGATPLWVAAYATNPGAGSASFRNRRQVAQSSDAVLRRLLAAEARPDITPDDGTTTLMAAAGCGRVAHLSNVPRAPRQQMDEAAVRTLVEAGVDVNATNEGDFTALHCAAFSGLPEVVRYLVEQGASINARDWRGRTAFRLAEGAKQSFHYQEWSGVADLLGTLGADTSLGIPGTVHERLRGLAAAQ